MPLEIVVGHLVDQNTDIIVSSISKRLLALNENSQEIFRKIGQQRIVEEIQKYQNIEITEALVTSGFDLCKYLIHAVSPDYEENSAVSEALLADTYNNALSKVLQLEAESVSFPLLAAAENGFPRHLALDTALRTIGSFIENHDLTVKLVLLPEEKSRKIKYPQLHRLIKKTVSEKFRCQKKVRGFGFLTKEAPEEKIAARKALQEDVMAESYERADSCYAPCLADSYSLDDILENMDISFSRTVLNLIDEKGYKDSDVYKRANLDRRLFSKLRSSDDYQPSKSTAIALAFALRLSVPQTDDLLLKAGYSLSKSNTSDIIVEYCLNNEIYNIYEVNEILFHYDQKQLGSI
ncbi:MAG TPA: macro domain-containing protein [Erysipelotrichaceae bacterium]|nr:macro domain-containing protein [Erysipelotrichaceae bacterium]HQB32961.1 macro domain-containing protein [Erysipelotrichaceae bacterium]